MEPDRQNSHSGWNPEQYLKFANQRLRPALELLAHIDLAAPKTVCDLGCGPGNVTPFLKSRWPEARLIGVDSSGEMLAKARLADPSTRWIQADIAHWWADQPLDLIYSNAALQWLGGHEMLFPRLLQHLAPGGVLAVQMPRNFDAPSHTGMREAAQEGPWADTLAPLLRHDPVARPEIYWDILTAAGASVDIWECDYLQVLRGDDAVVQWTLGTALKPLLDALEEPLRGQFLENYRRRMAKAYPQRSDGVTLFPFRRQFIVAKV
ncbi:MAG TPA: trans-aconitate 2-methyltransferase [Candidatus Sulfotelmatobacter sp.]|jgi:trans-aconitate 2-methyltransferase|nr:trans-aconitate 2-methyltransferase [Candidatus Sulfotelmatobacter sp.]